MLWVYSPRVYPKISTERGFYYKLVALVEASVAK